RRMDAVVAGAATVQRGGFIEVVEQELPSTGCALGIEHHLLEFAPVILLPLVHLSQFRLRAGGVERAAGEPRFGSAVTAADEISMGAPIFHLKQQHARSVLAVAPGTADLLIIGLERSG